MITIVNKKEKLYAGEPFKIYIGRPSIFGNPYSVKEYGRAGCIEKYNNYFQSIMQGTLKGPNFDYTGPGVRLRKAIIHLKKIHDVYGKLVLECWCAKGEITTKDKPYICHGQVIAEYLEKYMLERL